MKTREIARKEWPAFFDRFSVQHKGCGTTLELFGSEIRSEIEDRELLLEGATAKLSDVGDRIAIMIGAKPDNLLIHIIDGPNQVSLEQTDEGTDVALLIRAADGASRLMRFPLSAVAQAQ